MTILQGAFQELSSSVWFGSIPWSFAKFGFSIYQRDHSYLTNQQSYLASKYHKKVKFFPWYLTLRELSTTDKISFACVILVTYWFAFVVGCFWECPVCLFWMINLNLGKICVNYLVCFGHRLPLGNIHHLFSKEPLWKRTKALWLCVIKVLLWAKRGKTPFLRF